MSKITKEQELDLAFFEYSRAKWLSDIAYKGKFVVISEQTLQAVFDRGEDAYRYAMENLTIGKFIIKEVLSKKDSAAYLPTPF